MKRILIVVLILAVIMMAGCNKDGVVENDVKLNNDISQQQEVVNHDETNIEKQPVEEEKVVIDYNNLVEDIYSQSEGENGADVHLPRINIKSDDVNMINSEIESKIKSTEFWKNPENYFYSRNDNVLSVVIESIFDNVYIDTADVYNIDLNSGKLLSNKELIANANINESDYDMRKIYKEEFKKINSSLLENKNEYAVDFYNSIDEKELKLSDEKIYFDVDNKLHVLLQFPYMAGPDGMYFVDVKL